jgi:quercetin 2,3-dioxygenase
MIQVRRAEERGHADYGWLNTYHTFSFNTYHDERFMGFRALRVINDDIIKPGQGFGTHPHRDMEIITFVLGGALEHKDSMGNGSIIRPGDVQRMSAGSGITHSEFNPSQDEKVQLLQIWILPKSKGIEPGYEQKAFLREDKLGQFRLMASEDGRDDSVSIFQDANIYASILEKDFKISMPLSLDRHAWIHVAYGRVRLGDQVLNSGDGVAVSEENVIELTGLDTSELLLFDLA